jgi:hypothetical protein
VGRRSLFKQLYSVPFKDDSALHRGLESPQARLRLEEKISAEIGVPADRIVIDVPERISFEIDIPIVGREDPRRPSPANLFSGRQGTEFPASLRRISLSCGREEGILAAAGGADFSTYLGAP